MTFNLPEADAVNNVIEHLTGCHPHRADRALPTRDQAVEALVLLADGAHKRLGAGYSGKRARERLAMWPGNTALRPADAESTPAYAYLRPFLGLSDRLPDGSPQDAPVRVDALRALMTEHSLLNVLLENAGEHAGVAEARQHQAEKFAHAHINAFEQVRARIHRELNFDASESAPPDDEHWARILDDLVRLTDQLAQPVDALTQDVDTPAAPEPAPHLVTITHLDPDFDLDDRQPHELLLADNATGGWISHLVTHSVACHLQSYGTACWFDEAWENGGCSSEHLTPGHYTVLPVLNDGGEHSHTGPFLDYQPLTGTPARES